MADDPEDRHEGWNVPFRMPALIGVAVPLALFVMILASGSWFNATLAPEMFRKPEIFPAPGLDTDISRATTDPERPTPLAPENVAIERAKRVVLKNGIPGWPEASQ